jgi:hypothetical protein
LGSALKSLASLATAFAFVAMTLAWLIPNHYPPWTSFYNESAMAIGLLTLVLLLLIRWFGGGHLKAEVGNRKCAPLVALILCCVALVPWLQWSVGILRFSGDAVIASAYILGAAVAMFVGFGLSGGRPGIAPFLCIAALVASLLSSLIVISQVFGFAIWGIWAEVTTADMRAVGNLAQPNNFATLVGLGVIGALHLYEHGRLTGRVAFALVLVLVFAGALTQSRVSLLFGVLVVVAILFAKRRHVLLRTPIRVVALLTFAHWTLMAALPWLLRQLFGESPMSLAVRGLSTPRFQMWRMLIESVNLVPWTGYGWLQVGAAELQVVDRHHPIEELWLQGHDIFVELVVWCGWPLGLLLSVALLYWFASRALRMRSTDATVGMLAIGFVGLHSLVELPYHYAYFLFPVALWAGVVEREESLPGARLPSGRWMLAPSLIAAILCVLIWAEYPAIEQDFRRVRFEAARIEGARAAETTPSAPLLSTLTSFLRFARTKPVEGMSADELLFMKEVATRYPYAASLSRLASALALNGQMDEARSTFIKIRYIYGDRMYLRSRSELQENAASGPSPLRELAALLPLPSELRP